MPVESLRADTPTQEVQIPEENGVVERDASQSHQKDETTFGGIVTMVKDLLYAVVAPLGVFKDEVNNLSGPFLARVNFITGYLTASYFAYNHGLSSDSTVLKFVVKPKFTRKLASIG